jgi:hypothetical protein
MGYGFFSSQSAGPGTDPVRLRQRDMGVERCRKEQWADALPWLASAFEQGIPDGKGWPVAASYLGYCIAALQGRRDEGAKLCRHALKAEVFSSEIWHNLARIHLLQGDRRQAVEAVKKGLGYEPDDTALWRMRAELGTRRDPPLRFLSRSHPVNRVLGRVRSAFRGNGGAPAHESAAARRDPATESGALRRDPSRESGAVRRDPTKETVTSRREPTKETGASRRDPQTEGGSQRRDPTTTSGALRRPPPEKH